MQVLTEEDTTAFTARPLVFYEYHKMPFELANAPNTFHRVMGKCMADLHIRELFSFLDDLNVPSTDYF